MSEETETAQEPVEEEEKPSEEKLVLRHITKVAAEAKQALLEYDLSKGETARLKKIWEDKEKRLHDAIDEANSPQGRLPFGETAGSEAPWDGADDPRAKVPVIELGGNLTPSMLKKLDAAGIVTIEDLVRFHAEKGLHNIKGFGEAAVTKLEDALEAFIAGFGLKTEEEATEEPAEAAE